MCRKAASLLNNRNKTGASYVQKLKEGRRAIKKNSEETEKNRMIGRKNIVPEHASSLYMHVLIMNV